MGGEDARQRGGAFLLLLLLLFGRRWRGGGVSFAICVLLALVKACLAYSINVTLQVRGYPMPCIVELQMQTQPQQGGVLLHQLRDLHLDLVAKHL
uniref:Uncharacterized protein n=1 Tax=Anopheles darlingi TaxID=43151 RepID=A0A2M4D188_ANODA